MTAEGWVQGPRRGPGKQLGPGQPQGVWETRWAGLAGGEGTYLAREEKTHLGTRSRLPVGFNEARARGRELLPPGPGVRILFKKQHLVV